MKDLRGTRYCNRCETRHYNMQRCPRFTGPDDTRKPPPGYREKQHRMQTMEVRAGTNTLQFPQKTARRVGKLTDPMLDDAA